MTTRPGTAPVVPDELLRHLDEREQDVHAEADRLRAEIAELSARLEDIQQVVSRLRLTRQTLLEIAGQQGEQDQPGTVGAGEPLPPAYQEILAVFTRIDGDLRAKDLCRALNPLCQTAVRHRRMSHFDVKQGETGPPRQ
ncbi:hypothetical protein GCM10023075_80250 [Streptosporangium album]